MFYLRRRLGRAAIGAAAALGVRSKAWLSPDEDALIPPRDLWVGPDDSIQHYFRWPWEYLAYLTVIAGLQREDSVLELGCGHGRTMRGLLEYLRSPGRYVGLDVNDARIQDARRRITARWSNFNFVRADVHNAQDNPNGVPAASYRFPCDEASCDVIYAASLFTHLLPDEVRHYLRESRRVLKPGGRCLFSWFLLDHYRGPGTAISPLYDFEVPYPGHEGVAVRDAEHPERAIAYRTDVLEGYARDAGLRVDRVLPGLWHESPGFAVNEQDLLLLTTDAG